MSFRYFNLIILALSLHSQPGFSADLLKVLIIDTGVDSSDPTLSEMFCPPANSVDFTTSVYSKFGPQLSHKYGIPKDATGHGTHVTGIIRALAGNLGYCLAFCKYFKPGAPEGSTIENTQKCFAHAKAIGAKYVNYSSGGGTFSELEKQSIKLSNAEVIVAAGNLNENIDIIQYYPADYNLPNVTVAGALNKNCEKSTLSNYGTRVNFYIGEDIYSSLPDNTRGYLSGSSMATAVATGLRLRSILGLRPIDGCQTQWSFLKAFWDTH